MVLPTITPPVLSASYVMGRTAPGESPRWRVLRRFSLGLPSPPSYFLTSAIPSSSNCDWRFPFWAAAILSSSDPLVFFHLERFQEIASENESIGHIETIGLIVREFRSNGLAAEDITNG